MGRVRFDPHCSASLKSNKESAKTKRPGQQECSWPCFSNGRVGRGIHGWIFGISRWLFETSCRGCQGSEASRGREGFKATAGKSYKRREESKTRKVSETYSGRSCGGKQFQTWRYVRAVPRYCQSEGRSLTRLSLLFTFVARFDVFRQGKEKKPRFYTAVVDRVDNSGPTLRILFHYAKTGSKYDEWIEFGSARICTFNSKVPFQEKKVRKKIVKADDENSQRSVSHDGSDAPTRNHDSNISANSTSSTIENIAVSTSLAQAMPALPPREYPGYGVKVVNREPTVMTFDQPGRVRSPQDNGSTFFPFPAESSGGGNYQGGSATGEGHYRAERQFVEPSRNGQYNQNQSSGVSAQHRQSESSGPRAFDYGVYETNRGNSFSENNWRPPSFTTHGRVDHVIIPAPAVDRGFGGIAMTPVTHQVQATTAPPSSGSRRALSGLDMLAAVTSSGAFASILESAPKPTVPAQSYVQPQTQSEIWQQQQQQSDPTYFSNGNNQPGRY